MKHDKTMRTHAPVQQGARAVAVCALAGMLAACAQAPKAMYDWQAYQPSVYAYLKDEDADFSQQLQALESNVETVRANDTALPPGFRAHLGLLYLKMGLGDRAVEQLQAEKRAFPEGATFMDFLLRNMASDAGRSSADTDKPVGKQ